jgi:hypothetical protein
MECMELGLECRKRKRSKEGWSSLDIGSSPTKDAGNGIAGSFPNNVCRPLCGRGEAVLLCLYTSFQVW